MAFPVALVIIPFGTLFLLSGLIVNIIQAIFFITIRPFSRNMYRRINRVMVELLWLQLVWLFDWWAAIEVQVYADAETLESMGKEHLLVIPNHRSDVDWLVGWILAERTGYLGSTVAIMKKSSKYLPVIGWSMWFSEYLFLERSWAKDEVTLKSGLQNLKDSPRPFMLALFVEGTRFTEAKLSAAQEFAASRGLPIPKNTLVPRTKGFVSSVNIMRSFVPAIYDVTVAIPRDQPSPTMVRILKGQSSVIHLHLKRHSMNELPDSDDGIAEWCKNIFISKDALLEKHRNCGTFGDKEFKSIGRPKKSLLVIIFWACLVGFAMYEFIRWTALFSTWTGIAFTMVSLLLITITMQIFILFSQSERSTPAKSQACQAEERLEDQLTKSLI
ncbi:1-acyl-sn-glycerol-3-phosphate acyltransferase PLS1-like [Dioscorea cayenensis subsp. rotundata]|uniref:1-acylglycerol-3-phosphate O-acyltransferase n=1 Tax=Dioscorea cayennensis subsp. rotundata TaxID=55577 RepID=A0AB40AHS2_DIOCR|nr:1-acyl-sn-glycerol-3-phosphate acyltransferase PLS1-like [Dioscorea cayenensis subsp. rotundata]